MKANRTLATAPEPVPKIVNGIYLRYVGFEQDGRVRQYHFSRICPEDKTREFVVSVDLTLFLKHRMRLQEGPMVAFRFLSAALNSPGSVAYPRLRALSDWDVLSYLERPEVAGHKAGN